LNATPPDAVANPGDFQNVVEVVEVVEVEYVGVVDHDG